MNEILRDLKQKMDEWNQRADVADREAMNYTKQANGALSIGNAAKAKAEEYEEAIRRIEAEEK